MGWLWGLWGCLASEVVVTTSVPGDDSARPVDTAPPETTDSGEAPVVWVPDYAQWSGTLRFVGDTWLGSCDDTVQEVGTLLPADDPAYGQCASCDVIFSLEPTPAQGCVVNGTVNVPLERPTLRGLDLGSGWAAVYNVEEGGARLLDSGASLEEGVLRFEYSASLLGELVAVTGEVTFPLVASR